MGTLSMTVAERERFLADVHVGVLSIERAGRAPLAVPIWYDYQPGGDVTILTEGTSVKRGLLTTASRFSLCAQREEPPYQYVTVEGPVTSTAPADIDGDVRPMAVRYLGERDGNRYVESVAPALDEVRITMHPERWLSQDYTKAQPD